VLIASVGVVSAMLLGAMSVVSVTAEHAHGTIRPTYAATPDRLRVTLAKLSTNSFVALVVAALTVMLSWVISSTILDSRDQPVAIGDDGVLATLVSMVALTVVVTWFALGLGLVIRNSPATVTLFLLWPLLIESLVGLVLTLVGWEGAPKWLPYGAGISAAVGEGDGGTETLGRPNGLIYFGVVTLAIVALGAWSDNRRDA
jgi:ABC-2 type transport system permease protein